MFREGGSSKAVAVQILLSGAYALPKLKKKIGHRDPRLAAKDSLRSFYGYNRLDNAFFVSENFSESLIEKDTLFTPDTLPDSTL